MDPDLGDGGPLLAGTVVVGLGGLGPSARALRILADYGATVWVVDRPPTEGSHRWEVPFHAYAGGRGWRRAEIDIGCDRGRDAFLQVTDAVDVVVDGLRPGAADRQGIGAGEATGRNPRLIWCAASGYGSEGPYSSWAGHDINYAGLSGFTAMAQPRADGAPPLTGVSMADAAGGGMHVAIAVLAALVRRAVSGGGTVLDCAATDGMVSLVALALDEQLAAGTDEEHPGGGLLRGQFACYDHYEAADGRWLAVGAIEPRFFANLCAATGLDHLIAQQYDPAAQDRLRNELGTTFRARPRDEWVEALGHLDTCVTPVLEPREVLANRHLAARRLVLEADYEGHGRHRQVGPALGGTTPIEGPVRIPARGTTDTRALLLASGLDAASIDQLVADGVAR